MGYAGGTRSAPTYHHLGDHSESIEVTFDPAVISYEALLDVFFSSHDPRGADITQYRSAIFTSGAAQRRSATEALARWEAAHGDASTAIEDAGPFTPAEDYHQKFYLRAGGPVWTTFHAMYPDTDDLVRSTAAARVNGWLGESYVDDDVVRSQLTDVGLSPEIGEALINSRGL